MIKGLACALDYGSGSFSESKDSGVSAGLLDDGTIPTSASHVTLSFTISLLIQGIEMAAHTPAHKNGTAQPRTTLANLLKSDWQQHSYQEHTRRGVELGVCRQ